MVGILDYIWLVPAFPLLGVILNGAIALFALQAVAAGRLELTFDEAYYSLWSRFLAFGYLDHPPIVALLIRGSTVLFGASELGVRALSLLFVAALWSIMAQAACDGWADSSLTIAVRICDAIM